MILRAIMLFGTLPLAFAQSHTITGVVLDADSSMPLSNSRVEIQSQNQEGGVAVPLAVLSGQAGAFRITNVPAGNYFLYTAKSGYVPPDLPGKNSAQSVALAGPATTVEIKFWLRRQGSVDGTLVDESGSAVSNIAINLLRVNNDDGRPRYEMANGAMTDSTGAFRISSLQPGKYVIGVNLTGGQTNEAGRLAFPSLFFPNAVDPGGAKLIELVAGANESVAIAMRRVPAFEVRGKVEANGRYANLVLRAVRTAGMPFSREFQGIWNQSTQTFVFRGIPAGSYELSASIQAENKLFSVKQAVVVSDSDITNIVLKVQ